jgi:hypothetical protein
MTGTVVTIHENPFPFSHLPSITDESVEGRSIAIIRRNIWRIFKQIARAKSEDESDKNPVMSLRVREYLPPGHAKVTQACRDAPSLLFYYIFDDWYAAYNLVAQKGHQYEIRLEQLVSIARASPRKLTMPTLLSGNICLRSLW